MSYFKVVVLLLYLVFVFFSIRLAGEQNFSLVFCLAPQSEFVDASPFRIQRFLNRIASMETPSPEFYYEMRRYKTKELMRACSILSRDFQNNEKLIGIILNFIIERKQNRIHEIDQQNQKGEYVKNYKPVRVPWDLAIEFVMKLPQKWRSLIPKYSTKYIYNQVIKNGRWFSYPEVVSRVNEDAIMKIKKLLPQEGRKSAVYYGAGMDIITPIFILKDLTDTIRYVDCSGFDELFYPGIDFLSHAFAPYGITVVHVSEKERTIRIKIKEREMVLKFFRSDNNQFAHYSQKGDGLIYVYGLASSSPREILHAHLSANPQGVVAFFIDHYFLAGFNVDIHTETISEGIVFYQLNPNPINKNQLSPNPITKNPERTDFLSRYIYPLGTSLINFFIGRESETPSAVKNCSPALIMEDLAVVRASL